MSSEQKKFSPELMEGDSLGGKIRGFLRSILDIGRSIRVRLSRIAKPDYDAISDIMSERNNILGHDFKEGEQKRAEPIDPTLAKANQVVKDLDSMEVKDPVPESEVKVEPEDVPPEEVVTEPSVDVTEPTDEVIDEPVEEKVVESEVIEVVDEVADIMKVVDGSIDDSEKIFEDEVNAEMVTNIISIHDHDELMDQMTIDDPSYGSFEESAPKFPETRPVQKQTTLDIIDKSVKVEESVAAVPWYTDADLIRIGIRAATEDCIETIVPLMEMFDEPEVVDEPVVDELDAKLTAMAVKAMTDDAVETVIIRIAQAARAAEALAKPVVEGPIAEATVEEPVIEESVVVDESVEVKIAQAAMVAGSLVKPVVEGPIAEATVEEPVIEESVVADAPVSVTEETVIKDGRTSISFTFGTGAAKSPSTGIRFRFGVLSQ